MSGLSVSDIVSVDVTISPIAAALRNFGSLLILGSTNVIDTTERMRSYSDMTGVGADFGVTDPEYLAAEAFFSQSPQPGLVYIGRWAQTATSAVLHGGALSTAQQTLTNFTAINGSGTFDITIDGTPIALTTVDFSAATSLNDVASILTTDLSGAGTVTWDSNYQRFNVESTTTGATSTITAATGTVADAMLLTSANASTPVDGIDAETLSTAVQAFISLSNSWYGLYVAAASVADSDHESVAGIIEAASPSRIYGITLTTSTELDPTNTTSLGYLLKQSNYERTFTQYSSKSNYAACSIFGRAFTVDFLAQNTTLTIKFKTEPGIAAETLTKTQADALKAKNINVFVNYNNSTAIIQEGVMANGYFFDEVHGLDWLQNYIQTNVYNLLYLSPTKIPQTDAGVNLITTTVEQSCDQAVTNGLLAPGKWDSSYEFGSLKSGDTLTKGYYVYAPSVDTQTAAVRATRTAPTIQVAAKLAGAVHFVNVLVNVNR